MTLSIYGGSGIIGSNFTRLFGGLLIPRDTLGPRSSEVLYLISTTSNFYDNPVIHGETNINCLLARLEACAANKISSFNFVSSWFVYGNKKELMKEEDYCEPHGLYSITKRCAEQLVIDYCNHHEIKWRIFRLPNVYGGPDLSDGRRNALHFMVQQLALGQRVKCVKGIKRDYMHIDDVCSAIYYLCQRGALNSIYNIGTGRSTDLDWCLNFCKNKLNSDSEIQWMEAPLGAQSLAMALDCSKLFDLGFTPSIPLERGLTHLCTNLKSYTRDHSLMDER